MGWTIGGKDLVSKVACANQYIYSYSSPIYEKCLELSLIDLMKPESTFLKD